MSSPRQCLIIDPMHSSIFTMLEKMGWQGVDASSKSITEVKSILQHYEGLFVRTRTIVNEELLGQHPTIKFVARAGAGLDNIDQDYLQRHQIAVVHASEGNRDAVGEYAIGALLSLLRNIPRADKEVRNSVWLREENRGEEIMGKTIGLIGYGNMGQAFAQRLSGFACTVLAYDKYKKNFSDQFATESSLEEIWRQADMLSLHIPLTAETKYMINDSFLERFSKPIIFINTSRGEIVKLQTVASAIHSGKIKGAVLDVLENEKLGTLTIDQAEAFTFLRNQTNVVLTPHIAGWTVESHIKINEVLVQKLKALGF
jgi:D-3-phosphoglycerate dehydrogenase / 2-oxoglutarate reductase